MLPLIFSPRNPGSAEGGTNFFRPVAYSLHPCAGNIADKRVAAKLMAHGWQADFEQIVDEHQSMVFSLAWRMTGDRGLAEEIAQDVFMELDRHMTRIESPQHPCYWLRRVAINRSADALRRRRVRGVDLWVEVEEQHGAPVEERQSPLSARLEQLLSTL